MGWLIGTPFNNKASVLEERLTVVEGNGVDPGNGGVRNGKFGPTMSGDTGAGSKREEIKRSLGITSGTDGNRAHGAGMWGVGRSWLAKVWAYAPNSMRMEIKSGHGCPMTRAEGLRVSEMPAGQGNWLRQQTTSVTM